jgi:hypothetical protein
MKLLVILLLVCSCSATVTPKPKFQWTPKLRELFLQELNKRSYRPQDRIPTTPFTPRYQSWTPNPRQRA